MAAVTICSDFGAKINKVCHSSNTFCNFCISSNTSVIFSGNRKHRPQGVRILMPCFVLFSSQSLEMCISFNIHTQGNTIWILLWPLPEVTGGGTPLHSPLVQSTIYHWRESSSCDRPALPTLNAVVFKLCTRTCHGLRWGGLMGKTLQLIPIQQTSFIFNTS